MSCTAFDITSEFINEYTDNDYPNILIMIIRIY